MPFCILKEKRYVFMKLKKWLLGLVTFAAMVVLCVVCAGAETYGDFEYSVLDDGTVEISGYNGSAEKVDIPEKIDGKSVTSIGYRAFEYCASLTNVAIPNGVTEICANAFSGCTSLTSITIPNSVTEIGSWAFNGCTSLTSITIPDGVTNIGMSAFDWCRDLESITIPNSVTSIGESAFRYCTNLKGITIPSGVTSIGNGAFENCTNLTEIKVSTKNAKYVSVNGVLYNKNKTTIMCYPAGKKDKSYKIINSVSSIIANAFSGCDSITNITIPNSVTEIGSSAFSRCTSLTSITIPNSVTEIYDYTFEHCTSLKSITIPNSVTSIGYRAFEYCTSLTNVAIPNSVTEIGSSAFSRCTSLKSITIPNSVTSIGESAFEDCSSLTNITIPNSVTEICGSAFEDCSSLTNITIPNSVTKIGWYAFKGCTSLKSITIPNSVTNIGGWAFSDCTSLTSITIPDSVTEIGSGAFSGCTSLTNITILNSVTDIGRSAFEDCSSLTNITIPNSVTSIGESAFEDCSSLTNITIPNSVTDIGRSAFSGCTSIKSITIPDSVTSIGSSAFSGCRSLTSITIPNSVTDIGSSAFYGCTSLTSVTIPDRVTSIDSSAFGGCSSLTAINVATENQNYISVNGVLYNKDKTTIMRYPAGKKDKNYKIPDGVTSIDDYTFKDCISLTSITIPDGVTSIGSSAFEGCTSLASITIPDSVTSIDRYAFCGCTSLTNITIPGSVTIIGSWAFKYCTSLTAINVASENRNYVSVNGVLYNKNKTTIECYPAGKKDKNYKIPDGVTSIDRFAFSGCTNVTSITIPVSVTSIDKYAFSGCLSVKSITIPVSVTSIDKYAFRGCSSLTSITIPDGATSIGNWAFKDCTSLASVTIPSSVAEIGGYVFENCISLTEIKVASTNSNFASVDGILYNKDKTTIKCYPAGKKNESYTINDGVMYIGSEAFEYCVNLKSVIIPNSVKSIEAYAFIGCANLRSVTIPDSVTLIEREAFENCQNLMSVTIPSSVEYIYTLAFGYYYDNGYKKMDNFKVYCYSGTEGEKYAIDNGFDYVLLDKLPTLSKVTGAKLAGRAADALRINWTKNTNADGYIVEMYQNGKWARVAKITNSNTTTYRKAGLKAGTVYKFRVKAYKMNDRTAVYSDYSATVAAMTNPSVMTGTKLGGRAADALRINWTKNASADGYIVEMYQGNKWVRVAKITNSNTTTFRKAGLKASSVYKFRVRAYKMSGSTALYGDYSATVTAMTNPSVMTGAKIGGRAADALRINWSKNASADGYIVEMYQGNKWVRVAKITSNSTTTFRKAGLKASSVYKFRVSAYKMSGKTALYGNYSTTVTARTNPSIVKGVKIAGKAKDALRVNWTKNTSAQGYIVEMYKGGKWVRVAKITNSNTATFRKAGLAKNTTYKFRVCAYYMSGKTALYGNYGSVSGKTAAK